MSEFMDNIGFTIWSKGPIALNITKSAVCTYVTDTWKNEIRSWPSDDEAHVPIFLKDVEDEEIKLEGVKKKETRFKEIEPVYHCNHDRCKQILVRLQDLHQNPKKIVLKKENHKEGDVSWKLARMYRHGGDYPGSKPSTGPEDTEAAMVFKMMKSCKLFDLDNNIFYEYLRDVRNALMHSPTLQLTYDELDSYIKVMKDFLEAVHESEGHKNCNGSECYFKKDIGKAISELNMLQGRKTPFERTMEDIEMINVAFKEQRKALESDRQLLVIPGMKSSPLDSLLKENVKKTEEHLQFMTKFEYIFKLPDPASRKKEYESVLEKDRKEEEESLRAWQEKSSMEEERRIKEEVEKRVREEVEKRVREEVEKIKADDARRRMEEEMKQEKIKADDARKRMEEEMKQEKEREQREEERRRLDEEEKRKIMGIAVGSAATGAAIGAIVGPVGMVIGGAVGGIASLISKK